MSGHVEIVVKLLDAFYKNLDISVLRAYTTDTFKTIILPESLGIQETNKEEHLASGEKTAAKIKEYKKYEIIEVFESRNKVTAHVRSHAMLKDGSEWKNDAINIFTFNEEGKISYLKEFIDSLETSKVAANLTA
ncbi:hypothetical protein DL96DRAFT_1805314 [Flagelloscypha sp. PMI_526]|nr:hypothetical protein DL96DRAFT_1805314 [Flagelloscypha sp. PMI_526]